MALKRFVRSPFVKCAKCPLRDRRRVWAEYPGDKPPSLMFIGESPGEEEEHGTPPRPFIGPAGGYLNAVLHEADVLRHRAWVTNLICCRPPGNSLDSPEGLAALECCLPGLLAEVAASGASVLVPLGTKPLQSLVGTKDGITAARGSVYQREGKVVIPTFHPSYILCGMKAEESTWIGDMKKAKSIAENGWTAPREEFNTRPSLADVERFVAQALKQRAPVAVDLETTGFRPESGRIIVIGLALDGERAISIPFLSQYGNHYWNPRDENTVRSLVKTLCAEKELLFQNGLGVDLPFLQYNGFEVKKTPHDVLLMHHVIHPELPHNLGYIVSVYGHTPYWKGEVLGRESRLLDLPDDQVRTYNLRDAVVLHQVFPGLREDLEEFNLWHVYDELERPLVLPVLEMEMTGLLVDTAALTTWKRSITARRAAWEKRVRSLASVPPAFSFTSDDHLRLLIYGEVADQFTRAQRELEEYDLPQKNGKPKRRDTKKYRECESLAHLLRDVTPLYRPAAKVRRTDTMRASVKKEYLIARKISCLNRLKEITSFKKKDGAHEKAEIERTVSFLDALFSFNEAKKLCSTYARFPIWKDGRVHSSYKVHGTNTGRLSSSAPNAQNIPEDARVIFVPRIGWSFVGPDYSNLEVWVQAYDANDPVMLEVLLAGKNIHDETARDLFGVGPSHRLWKSYRMAAKKYRFGHIQYGGTLRSIYEKLMLEVPDLPLTFNDLARADAQYLAKHPAHAEWVRRQTDLCLADPRIVTNAFGRRRILLGSDADVEREALNTPIQGTGADIVNTAMIRIYADFKKTALKARFVAQVHDQLLVECPDGEVTRVKRIMKKHMEATFHLWQRDVRFPVEMKVGKNWRDLKKA